MAMHRELIASRAVRETNRVLGLTRPLSLPVLLRSLLGLVVLWLILLDLMPPFDFAAYSYPFVAAALLWALTFAWQFWLADRALEGFDLPVQFTDLTLGDYLASDYDLDATCTACRTKVRLDIALLARQLGEDKPMDAVLADFKCKACGSQERPQIVVSGRRGPLPQSDNGG